MHYKNGKEAKVGDRVICKRENEVTPTMGVIVSVQPGSTTCNAMVVPFNTIQYSITLSDTLLLEDAVITAKETETKDAKSE